MSRIKNAIATAKRIVVGESVHEALTRRRREAGQQWRDMVAAAADGRAIDIDQLSLAGGLLGIGTTRIAGVFDADRAAWLEQQSLAASAASSAAHAQEVDRQATIAQEQLEEARQRYETLRQQAAAAGWAHVSAGHVEAQALQHRRSHARLWPADSLLDPVALAEAVAAPDEPAADEHDHEPVPAGAADADGGAYWEDD